MDRLELPPIHPHTLMLKLSCWKHCQVCHLENENNVDDYYSCYLCKVDFHVGCVESSPSTIKHHPLHPRHPLTLITSGAPDYDFDGKCQLCGYSLKELLYHCSICNFSVHTFCARKPPPVDIEHSKSHDHMLTLLPRSMIFFTCNACGFNGDRYPYVCYRCDFMVHKGCVNLPHVIRITRHQHRISYTPFLPRGNWFCKICHREVDGKYGEYSCNNKNGSCAYFVHTKCATRDDIWDGKELEGESEEPDEFEDVKLFKVIDEGIINHYSHDEHNLRLNEDCSACDEDEDKRCEACTLPVLFDPFYSCVHKDCQFILHKKCAHLPQKIQHLSHRHPLTLHVDHMKSEDLYSKYLFICTACGKESSGFKYKCLEVGCDFQLNARCALVSEPFNHAGHKHSLFFPLYDNKGKKCHGCGEESDYMLNCIKCEDFVLDFKCATLPAAVRYKYDEHLQLDLCYGLREASGRQYWCEECEEEIDPKKWFYACGDCGVMSHVICTLKGIDFIYLRPGRSFTLSDYEFKMASNISIPRPLCKICHYRCLRNPAFKRFDKYICSGKCLRYDISGYYV